MREATNLENLLALHRELYEKGPGSSEADAEVLTAQDYSGKTTLYLQEEPAPLASPQAKWPREPDLDLQAANPDEIELPPEFYFPEAASTQTVDKPAAEVASASWESRRCCQSMEDEY